jgi:hypothetical protein
LKRLYYQKNRLTLKNGSCGFPIIIVEQFAQALAASDASFGLQRTKFWPDELVDWQAHIAIPFFFGFARVFGQYGGPGGDERSLARLGTVGARQRFPKNIPR